jgi:hypothetical protein
MRLVRMHYLGFATVLVTVTILGVSASPAAAQSAQSPGGYPPAYVTARSDGMMFGVAVGGGDLSCTSESDVCDGVTEAGSISGHVGMMFGPRLAAVFDLWVMAHTEDDFTISHTIATVGAQYWLMPRLWVRAGVGGAHAGYHYDGPFVEVGDRTKTVLGVTVAAGVDVISRPRFTLDVQLRGGTGFYGDDDDDDDVQAHNAGVQVGFTWF